MYIVNPWLCERFGLAKNYTLKSPPPALVWMSILLTDGIDTYNKHIKYGVHRGHAYRQTDVLWKFV